MAEDSFADIVLMNGVVYTADADDTVCHAVALKGDRIVFVGNNEQISDYIGKETKKIDLDGRMVIPGMIDSHSHPPGVALSELYEVQLFGINSLEGYIDAVRDFITLHPDAKVVFGQGWLWSAFSGEELIKGPRKEHLDKVVPSIPVILRAMDGHSWWVNSAALAISGITSETKATEGGIIEKDDKNGELWGTVKENAISLVIQPEYSLEQYIEALLVFQRKMHSLGITGVLSIMGRFTDILLQAWQHLDKHVALAMHVRGAIMVHPQDDLFNQIENIARMRSESESNNFKLTTVKFFADGVVEGGTSHLLEPYTIETGKGSNYYGDFLWSLEMLKHAIYHSNQSGLQIHVHSTGDAATRKVLDALEAAYLPGDFRNTITHLQLVDQTDVARFKKLKVIASVQPGWHFKGPNWWQTVDYRILGERAEYEYPLRTFISEGVIIASSSDYPITPLPNPLFAIDTGVTRNMYSGRAFGVEDIVDKDDERYLLNKDERVSVLDMLRSFTINGAYSLFIEKETGSIEVGKQADLVVLEKDLLSIDPISIDNVKVDMTIFAGVIVYNNDTAKNTHKYKRR